MTPAYLCPCGSGTTFAHCCGPYLDGHPAPTAEALMRSRFTAYSRGDEDHVFRTWHPRTRPADLHLAGPAPFLGLEVLETVDGGPDDETGTVTFIAYTTAGDLRETSRFERRAGRWVYVDGDVQRPV